MLMILMQKGWGVFEPIATNMTGHATMWGEVNVSLYQIVSCFSAFSALAQPYLVSHRKRFARQELGKIGVEWEFLR